MEAKLGDWVKETKYGRIGRVTRKDHMCGESQAWLDAQEIPFSTKDLSTPWYAILCIHGGAVVTSENYIEVIEPQGNLNNTWEDFYF